MSSPDREPSEPLRPSSLQELSALVGVELGPTRWKVVDQERIDAFARDIEDLQWIHVDVARATAERGSTIAHGMLTLSLGTSFTTELIAFDNFERAVNYGFEKVRFPEIVPVDARIRMRACIADVAAVDGGAQARVVQTFEREDVAKPVCVAQALIRFYVSQSASAE